MGLPLVLINFSVNPEAESEFNRFYHHEFLPHLLKESPEIKNVRRYEEFGVAGSLRWYNKQFLTVYQLTVPEAIAQADAIFGRPAVSDVVKTFRDWKDKALRNFSRITFQHTWSHQRKPVDGAFSGRPFFLWQLEMKPELDKDFQDWYAQFYLPRQISEVPTWSGANRYESVGKEPTRHLTFFEAPDESTFLRCLSDLRAAHRIEENLAWQKRVESAVTWQDTTSFRPFFRWPD